MKRTFTFAIFSVIAILLAACGRSAAVSPTATPPPQPAEVVISPPTAIPAAPAAPAKVSLAEGAPPPPALPSAAVPGAVSTPAAVRNPRYNTGSFSFVPPSGWEVVELAEKRVYLVRQAGDDGVFTGENNQSPYVYLKLVDSPTAPLNLLDEMRRQVGGVSLTEPAAAPILDGARGAGRFAEGRNDAVPFRSYLVVVPAGKGKMLEMVFWGEKGAWATVAPQMAVVLETIRLPES